MEQNKPSINIFRVLLKAGILFVLFNFVFIFINADALGKLTLYNSLFTGRERFPFGETREAYNLSLYNLDAMFASHILSGMEKTSDELRVLLIGDSSVWGTLLTPGQTLAGQLNATPITACEKTVRAYNLGYPTISLMKELLILDQALAYQPDIIVWLTTLESFPLDKQFESPLVVNNTERVQQLVANYQLPYDPNDPALVQPSKWDQTFVGQRRALADLLRLQMYGALWASTGIDQVYPENYERAQIDLEASEDFHGLDTLQENLALDVLDAGMSTGIPTLLVNEPILISNGQNSDIRYDFYYPRWAYDEYRTLLADHASENNWNYMDLWDLVPMDEFTNSAVHLTPHGESLLTAQVAREIQNICK